MYNQSGDIEIGNCKFIGISNNIRSDNYLSTEQRIFLVDFIVKRSNIPNEFLRDFFNLGGDSYGNTF